MTISDRMIRRIEAASELRTLVDARLLRFAGLTGHEDAVNAITVALLIVDAIEEGSRRIVLKLPE